MLYFQGNSNALEEEVEVKVSGKLESLLLHVIEPST